MMHPDRPVIAEVLVPVGDYPWVVKMEDGKPRQYYSDEDEVMLDLKGIAKTYGLNQTRTHVKFQFHNVEDLPRILVFKMKWGRK